MSLFRFLQIVFVLHFLILVLHFLILVLYFLIRGFHFLILAFNFLQLVFHWLQLVTQIELEAGVPLLAVDVDGVVGVLGTLT